MQTYPIKLSYGQPSQSVGTAGDLFVYESGLIASRRNLVSDSEGGTGWSAGGTTPPTVANAVSYLDALAGRIDFAAGLTSGYAGSRANSFGNAAAVAVGKYYAWSADVSLSRALTGTETLQVYATGANGTNFVVIDATNSAQFVGAWVRVSASSPAAFALNGSVGISVFQSQQMLSPVSVYVTRQQVEEVAAALAPATPYIPSTLAGTSGSTGDPRIKVKAESGAEVILKPGQRVRMTERAQRWNVTSMDGITPITVNAIIGSGEFDDANTLNAFTFDTRSGAIPTTVQGPVTVQGELEIKNDAGNRLPVTLDPAQTNKMSNEGAIYDTAWGGTVATSQYVPIKIVDPAANLNGIKIARVIIQRDVAANSRGALIAKATAPTTDTDGDILHATVPDMSGVAAGMGAMYSSGEVIVVPPGKGLWFITSLATANIIKSVLYKVL